MKDYSNCKVKILNIINKISRIIFDQNDVEMLSPTTFFYILEISIYWAINCRHLYHVDLIAPQPCDDSYHRERKSQTAQLICLSAPKIIDC